MKVKITLNENAPVGKLADAELHFDDGPLAGLKLIGFAIWETRGAATQTYAGGSIRDSRRNVTFPARQYTINGDRRSFALLRPISDVAKSEALRNLILAAFNEHEHKE